MSFSNSADMHGETAMPPTSMDIVTPPGAPWTTPAAHPLLQPSASHETAEDMFDALDAFLESEFPELDSSMCQSPTGSSSWEEATVQKLVPQEQQPATSNSCLENIAPTPSTAEAVAALAPAAAAAAAAVKAIAQARNTAPQTSPFAASACFPTFSAATGLTPPINRAGSSSSSFSSNSTAMPRWKVYHMQQRQELLAPKTSQQEIQQQQQQPAQLQAAAVTPATAVAFGGSCSFVPIAASAGFPCGGIAAVPMPASVTAAPMISPDGMLLLNWQQQPQVQMQVQLQGAMAGKRAWSGELQAAESGLKKRSRVSAAGNIAAQHMYGLASEPCHLIQGGLQAYQLALQQQIQSQQIQVDMYQQQQLQALHQGLHLRLQLQQHQFAMAQSRQQLQECA